MPCTTCQSYDEYINSYFSEGDKLVPSVQKKINELEVGLLHLQQNIDIPEISLPIHATIQQLVDTKKKPTVEDLGSAVSDSTFLNALQKDVSRWIREIQKVSVYRRACDLGTYECWKVSLGDRL